MRILVTGGTGLVGCRTVAALAGSGHEVRLLVRAPERADASATARDLGVSFRPPEESIRGTVRWLHAAGHLSARRAGALAQPA